MDHMSAGKPYPALRTTSGLAYTCVVIIGRNGFVSGNSCFSPGLMRKQEFPKSMSFKSMRLPGLCCNMQFAGFKSRCKMERLCMCWRPMHMSCVQTWTSSEATWARHWTKSNKDSLQSSMTMWHRVSFSSWKYAPTNFAIWAHPDNVLWISTSMAHPAIALSSSREYLLQAQVMPETDAPLTRGCTRITLHACPFPTTPAWILT